MGRLLLLKRLDQAQLLEHLLLAKLHRGLQLLNGVEHLHLGVASKKRGSRVANQAPSRLFPHHRPPCSRGHTTPGTARRPNGWTSKLNNAGAVR